MLTSTPDESGTKRKLLLHGIDRKSDIRVDRAGDARELLYLVSSTSALFLSVSFRDDDEADFLSGEQS